MELEHSISPKIWCYIIIGYILCCTMFEPVFWRTFSCLHRHRHHSSSFIIILIIIIFAFSASLSDLSSSTFHATSFNLFYSLINILMFSWAMAYREVSILVRWVKRTLCNHLGLLMLQAKYSVLQFVDCLVSVVVASWKALTHFN